MIVRRALLSVSDKRGIAEFARGLHELGVTLLSTGGTAALIKSEGVPVTEVSDYTGFPELLDGRVKSLHPKIHGGLLARRDRQDDMASLEAHDIAPIDLVAVNLYPFADTARRPGVTLEECLEFIDIGGPALIRAAAKNFLGVIVITDSEEYPRVLAELRERGDISLTGRERLALRAFSHTARYDTSIAHYLSGMLGGDRRKFPPSITRGWDLAFTLRYGENPHQAAALYLDTLGPSSGAAHAQLLHGKAPSYNNYLDLDAALSLVLDLPAPGACIIKHNTPCGAASDATLAAAFRAAHAGDPLSAYGGVVACNAPVDDETAAAIAAAGFLEVIAAPGFSDGALATLKQSANLRLLTVSLESPPDGTYDWRRIAGGMLMQEMDTAVAEEPRVVTKRQPSAAEWEGLRFAERVAKHTRSNAIVLAQGTHAVGIGGGQTSRVDSVKQAVAKAGDRARGAALASDGFFPKRDAIDAAADAGVAAILQPGGSKSDDDIVAAADERGLAMVMTGMRHFKH